MKEMKINKLKINYLFVRKIKIKQLLRLIGKTVEIILVKLKKRKLIKYFSKNKIL
jgi:hypothetical protein